MGRLGLNERHFLLPLGVTFPEQRGPLLQPISPAYSPSQGLSEWGLGVSNELSIRRFRVSGSLDFQTDDFLSPWGHLVKGNDGDYYPLGMTPPVRVKLKPSSLEAERGTDELIAYLPDGTWMKFSPLTQTPRGTYAWYLTEARNTQGQSSFYHYEHRPEHVVYLKEVLYGGFEQDTAYRIGLDYEPLSLPTSSYRSSSLEVLDQRVT